MRQKILQIITLSNWGGAQRVVFDLADNLDKEKFEVEVACSPNGLLVEKLRARNIKVYEIKNLVRHLSPIDDTKAFFTLKKIIKKGKYDIVHCHSAKAGFLGRMAGKLAGVKKIYYTVHSWSFYNKGEYGFAEKVFLLMEKIGSLGVSKIICVSNRVMADGVRNKIAKPKKFLLIKNGIDFNVENKRDEIRVSYGIKSKEIVVAMVSRLAYPKDPFLFLQIACEILKQEKNIRFILVGDGSLSNKCHDFVAKEKLEEKILLVGEKSPIEARELFLAFDIFVLLSQFEGLPITILEAMFAGLPVIASNVGGISELIDSEKGGFLVRNNYFKEIKESIYYLIKNPRIRKQMGDYNSQKAKASFTLEKMIRAYTTLYLEGV
ncbi:MAG: glycosyltransferase family 4 protein [Candidatus Pacebacteria bacterium]|nr:glycosyltransferase family 4 protein [Candidatus Paceibacterota bacterium]